MYLSCSLEQKNVFYPETILCFLYIKALLMVVLVIKRIDFVGGGHSGEHLILTSHPHLKLSFLNFYKYPSLAHFSSVSTARKTAVVSVS